MGWQNHIGRLKTAYSMPRAGPANTKAGSFPPALAPYNYSLLRQQSLYRIGSGLLSRNSDHVAASQDWRLDLSYSAYFFLDGLVELRFERHANAGRLKTVLL